MTISHGGKHDVTFSGLHFSYFHLRKLFKASASTSSLLIVFLKFLSSLLQ
jgi:hypothetical protein